MAKKFVRGVTGVDDIEKFDKTLTNVNDLISDGKATYVHTKKGKNEFYYNITNAVNEIQSSDGTLTITKENDTVTIANNTLATKQELATKQNTLTAGDGIELKDNTISVIHNTESTVNEIQSSDGTLTITKENDTVTIANNTLATKQELATKQNTLTAGAGIELKGNTISVIHNPQSTVDCNNIITTQYLKVGDQTTNLPPGVQPYGILTVVRIADVVEQTYQDFFGGTGRYIRTGYESKNNIIWRPWEKIVTEIKT